MEWGGMGWTGGGVGWTGGGVGCSGYTSERLLLKYGWEISNQKGALRSLRGHELAACISILSLAWSPNTLPWTGRASELT